MTSAQSARIQAPSAGREGAFEELERRAWRLACAVDAFSARRDVRELRARLVLLLLELRCPLHGRPRRAWYVPGAVARMGARGLGKAWSGRWGGPAPVEKTLRRHLAALESAGVLIRAPGDYVPAPRDPAHPERRPRYPDSFHLLESDAAADWWARVGHRVLAAHPEARRSPALWKILLGNWRERLRDGTGVSVQGILDFSHGEESRKDRPPDSGAPAADFRGLAPPAGSRARAGARPMHPADQLERLEEVLDRPDVTPADVVAVLDRCGIRLQGAHRLRVQRDLFRLRGLVALLAAAWRRGDTVRDPAAWLVGVGLRAERGELTAALERRRSRAPDRRRARHAARAQLCAVLGPAGAFHLTRNLDASC